MKIAGFLCVVFAGIATIVDPVTAGPSDSCPKPESVNHDKIVPIIARGSISPLDKVAVKFQPMIRFDEYGCQSYPAVSEEGHVSGGLKPTGPPDGQCDDSTQGSQVYGRATWHQDMYAIVYTWYFPKEQVNGGLRHRHGWQTCVVWLNNPAVENPEILAVSVSYKGKFDKTSFPESNTLSGTHPKVMYLASSGMFNFALMTGIGGAIQNLIMWHQLSEKARCALNQKDWGKGVNMPITDKNFGTTLNNAVP